MERRAHSRARVWVSATLRIVYTESSWECRVSPPQLKTYVYCVAFRGVKILGKDSAGGLAWVWRDWRALTYVPLWHQLA